MAIEVQSLKGSGFSEELVTSVQNIESYLNHIVDEYASKNQSRVDRPVTELERLDEFTRAFDEEGPFNERFRESYKRAVAEMSARLL